MTHNRQAAYLFEGNDREPMEYTPELSRRARGIEVWAALRSLGRTGLAELIDRPCRLASRFAAGLKAGGYTILNDVELNQVLVSFGDAEKTQRVIKAVQEDGTCWCGGTYGRVILPCVSASHPGQPPNLISTIAWRQFCGLQAQSENRAILHLRNTSSVPVKPAMCSIYLAVLRLHPLRLASHRDN